VEMLWKTKLVKEEVVPFQFGLTGLVLIHRQITLYPQANITFQQGQLIYIHISTGLIIITCFINIIMLFIR
jgi:hypothetical protein